MVNNVFQGKPLVPKEVPKIDILRDEFGKETVEEYKGIVRADYGGNSVLDVLDYNNETGNVEGSTPYALVLFNERILKPRGLRTANIPELYFAHSNEVLNLEGTYEDVALILGSGEDPNSYLTKDVMRQVRARNKKQKLPARINLYDFSLGKDANAPNGLVFKLNEDVRVVHAPVYAGSNKRFSTFDENGDPISDESGDKTLYTRSSGLSRAFVDGGLVLGSGVVYLAGSGPGGRVIVVAEGDNGAYLLKLKEERDNLIREIEERYPQAEKVLRGK